MALDENSHPALTQRNFKQWGAEDMMEFWSGKSADFSDRPEIAPWLQTLSLPTGQAEHIFKVALESLCLESNGNPPTFHNWAAVAPWAPRRNMPMAVLIPSGEKKMLRSFIWLSSLKRLNPKRVFARISESMMIPARSRVATTVKTEPALLTCIALCQGDSSSSRIDPELKRFSPSQWKVTAVGFSLLLLTEDMNHSTSPPGSQFSCPQGAVLMPHKVLFSLGPCQNLLVSTIHPPPFPGLSSHRQVQSLPPPTHRKSNVCCVWLLTQKQARDCQGPPLASDPKSILRHSLNKSKANCPTLLWFLVFLNRFKSSTKSSQIN